MPHSPALRHCVTELEHYVASAGWDCPARLFALVNTAKALADHPELAGELPPHVIEAARCDPDHLTAIEQTLDPSTDIEDILPALAWPASVDGCALAIERIMLDDEASSQLPQDPDEARSFAAAHPSREDVRMIAAVLRDGSRLAAARFRSFPTPDAVPMGEDLAPDLCEVLALSLRD